jgi:hypothetical protein
MDGRAKGGNLFQERRGTWRRKRCASQAPRTVVVHQERLGNLVSESLGKRVLGDTEYRTEAIYESIIIGGMPFLRIFYTTDRGRGRPVIQSQGESFPMTAGDLFAPAGTSPSDERGEGVLSRICLGMAFSA